MRHAIGPSRRRLLHAGAAILVHNHPSGDDTPSEADLHFTMNAAACGAVLGIPLRDHLVIAPTGKFTSFRNKGLLQ